MKILIACEFSGIVREAFREKGHDCWSCDLLPSDQLGPHYQQDVLPLLYGKKRRHFDMLIAHPSCTDLAVSGARYFKEKIADGRQQKAMDFFMQMINAPVERICVENPVCIMSSKYRPPDQYIHPYMFGHPETKKTGLWLKNLPVLIPTNIVEPEFIIGKSDGKKYSPVHYCSRIKNGEERWKIRSRTYQGIADAMADQWNSEQ